MLADWMSLAKVREDRVQQQIEPFVRKVLERFDLPRRRDRVNWATWATKHPD